MKNLMRSKVTIFALICLLCGNVFVNKCIASGGSVLQKGAASEKQTLRISFNYLQFELNKDSAYAELQFLIWGNSLQYELQNGKYRVQVNINACFVPEFGVDTIKVSAKVFSDAYEDSATAVQNNIYDLLRIAVPKGKYMLYLEAADNYQKGEGVLFSDKMDMTFDNNTVQFSSLQPIAYMSVAENMGKYVKNGWEYVPYFSTYYSSEINSMVYWIDIYHTSTILGENVNFKVISSIVDEITDSVYMRKEKTFLSQASVFMQQAYDIELLPTGNYLLQLEVRDMNDTLHAYTSHFFQRSNIAFKNDSDRVASMFDYDTLKRYFDYISVIANSQERRFIDNFTKEQLAEGGWFFYDFWKSRNAEAPHEAWFEFYKKVQQVNNNYSTLRYKGYKTDRGQCYLKYGTPTEIEYHNFDGNVYPYEIWRYNQVPNGQVNVYFVFYNLDRTTKDYRLLHSTVNGEPKFPNWEEEVKSGKALIIENTEQYSQ